MNAAAAAAALAVDTTTAAAAAAAGAGPAGAFAALHGLAAAAAVMLPSAVGDYRRERSLAVHEIFQRKMLYCRSGYNLNVWPDGAVNGTAGKYGVLRFYTLATSFAFLWMDMAPDHGRPKIAIKGEASNLWLCMNPAGELYGNAKKTDECEFVEEVLANYYNAYYSAKYPLKTANGTRRWYVAIGNDGRPRLGRASRWRHRMSQFLPRYVGSGAVAAHISIQAALPPAGGFVQQQQPPPQLQPSRARMAAGTTRAAAVTSTATPVGKTGRRGEERVRRPDRTELGGRSAHKTSPPSPPSRGVLPAHGADRNRTSVGFEPPDRARHPRRKLEPHRRRGQALPPAVKSLASSLLWA